MHLLTRYIRGAGLSRFRVELKLPLTPGVPSGSRQLPDGDEAGPTVRRASQALSRQHLMRVCVLIIYNAEATKNTK